MSTTAAAKAREIAAIEHLPYARSGILHYYITFTDGGAARTKNNAPFVKLIGHRYRVGDAVFVHEERDRISNLETRNERHSRLLREGVDDEHARRYSGLPPVNIAEPWKEEHENLSLQGLDQRIEEYEHLIAGTEKRKAHARAEWDQRTAEQGNGQ